jgi:hypothetical protein
MRDTLDLALVRQVVVLLDRKGVGVGAQPARLRAGTCGPPRRRTPTTSPGRRYISTY